jgi:hypothetical protein
MPNRKPSIKPTFSLIANYQECLEVVDEFVRLVETKGEGPCETEWPNLFRTYLKARQIVRDTARAEG